MTTRGLIAFIAGTLFGTFLTLSVTGVDVFKKRPALSDLSKFSYGRNCTVPAHPNIKTEEHFLFRPNPSQPEKENQWFGIVTKMDRGLAIGQWKFKRAGEWRPLEDRFFVKNVAAQHQERWREKDPLEAKRLFVAWFNAEERMALEQEKRCEEYNDYFPRVDGFGGL